MEVQDQKFPAVEEPKVSTETKMKRYKHSHKQPESHSEQPSSSSGPRIFEVPRMTGNLLEDFANIQSIFDNEPVPFIEILQADYLVVDCIGEFKLHQVAPHRVKLENQTADFDQSVVPNLLQGNFHDYANRRFTVALAKWSFPLDDNWAR